MVVNVGTCVSVIMSHSLVCKAWHFFCDLHAKLRASLFSTHDPKDILLRSKCSAGKSAHNVVINR